MHRVIAHLRSNLIGWIALFVALGGTGYAAISIPRNSVGAAQIRNRSITPAKLNPNSIGGSVRAWAIIRANATVIASSGKPVVFASADAGLVHHPMGRAAPTNLRDGRQRRRAVARQTPVQLAKAAVRTSATIGYASNVDTETDAERWRPQDLEDQPRHVQPVGAAHPMAFDVAVIC